MPASSSSPAAVLLSQIDEIDVEVERLVAGGDGLARYQGVPIFIPRSAPGDRLRVRLVERRPDFGRAEIVEMLRSIADVCELDVVTEVLDSAPAFSMLHQGTLPFAGREGNRLWGQLVDTVAKRWDDVVDALDALVTVPAVDAAALTVAEKETVFTEEAEEVGELTEADAEDDEEELYRARATRTADYYRRKYP